MTSISMNSITVTVSVQLHPGAPMKVIPQTQHISATAVALGLFRATTHTRLQIPKLETASTTIIKKAAGCSRGRATR